MVSSPEANFNIQVALQRPLRTASPTSSPAPRPLGMQRPHSPRLPTAKRPLPRPAQSVAKPMLRMMRKITARPRRRLVLHVPRLLRRATKRRPKSLSRPSRRALLRILLRWKVILRLRVKMRTVKSMNLLMNPLARSLRVLPKSLYL